jgi:hypothetical protein
MSDFKIDKNIPITFESRNSKNYPFKDLEIGDSFLIPVLEDNYTTSRSSVVSSVKHFMSKDRKNREFLVRTKREEKGIRVWRIK